MMNVDDYNEVKTCNYKGEHYSARDNGAIMRHQRNGMRKRKLDDVWSFGTPNIATGYMDFCGERVHRIVATAFHGPAPSDQHVVDHIDTNRKNNRPDNLRWLTRLENALNNPITRARIENLCGSIEVFLADPSVLRGHERIDPNFSWMRAVSPEEARASFERLTNWAKEHPKPKGGSLGEWVFQERRAGFDSKGGPDSVTIDTNEWPSQPFSGDGDSDTIEEDIEWFESSTPTAKQSWGTKTEFPCCPAEVTEDGLEIYNENLKEGMVFSRNSYDTYYVVDSKVVKEKRILAILSTNNKEEGHYGTFSVCIVKIEKGFFVHISLRRSGYREDASHMYKVLIGEEKMTEEDEFFWDT